MGHEGVIRDLTHSTRSGILRQNTLKNMLSDDTTDTPWLARHAGAACAPQGRVGAVVSLG
jgi:hypothetical protein